MLVAGSLFSTNAGAQTYNEVGDAGQLVATATVLGGGISTITGTVSSGADADLYRFYWAGGGFSATTVGTSGTLSDTQLFLFGATGLGIVHNDDGGSLRAAITAIDLNAGWYHLGISSWSNDPLSATGAIFPSTFAGQLGPTGPGGADPLSGWEQDGGGSGTYEIVLRTATASVPEPSSVVLLLGALPLLGAAARRTRRR